MAVGVAARVRSYRLVNLWVKTSLLSSMRDQRKVTNERKFNGMYGVDGWLVVRNKGRSTANGARSHV